MAFFLSWAVEDWVCEKRGPRGAGCVSRLMSLKGLLWLISTGEMPAVPAPSGSEGGGICAMRGRATGRLCVVIRGVVSDAVPCLLTGVLCDLPFNVVGLPKKMGGMIAHPSMICQSPPRGFFAEIPASDPSRSSLRFHEKGGAIGALAYPQSVPWHTHNRLACFP